MGEDLTPDSALTPDVPAGDTITAEQAQDVATGVTGVVAAVKAPTLVNLETAGAEVAAVVGDAPAIIEETRRGYKTSEFYASVATVAADLGLDISDKTKLIISGIVAVYTLSRSIAKHGVPNITPIPPA